MSAVLPVYARCNLTFESGQGVFLTEKNGDEYLDLAAGIAVNSMGHSHPHLVHALTEQAKKLWHVSNMYQIDKLEALAQRIVDATDFADKAFFCNSGAEAVECGLKMIRKYQHGVGNPHKFRVITFAGCFHGRTLATISAAKKDKVMEGFTPEVDGFDQVPFGDLEALKAAITPETGGILVEPVQGEGGIRPASQAFLQGLRDVCDEHDLILFFDGIQCGMGRTGKFFSHEWTGVAPDITSSAKGIGGGFPLGACLSNDKVAQYMTPGSHGSTYAGGPLAVAAAGAVMDIMLADGFLDDVAAKGEYCMEKLAELVEEYPTVLEGVRGKGLMIGLQVKRESREFVGLLRDRKVLTAPAAENIVRLLPPLTITRDELDLGIARIKSLCEELK